MQYFFPVQKRTLYAPPVCDFIFELPCTSVESYVRLHVKTSISFFFVRCGDHTYHVLGTRYLYGSSLYCCRWSLQQVPRLHCCAKKVTPLESSQGHHLPARAASASAARGRCFDPKRAATAPGCRACSASREHRVGSLLIAGQNQTQAYSSSSTTRSSSTTPDDGSHPPHRPLPMLYCENSWLRAGRVGLCATTSVCVRSS